MRKLIYISMLLSFAVISCKTSSVSKLTNTTFEKTSSDEIEIFFIDSSNLPKNEFLEIAKISINKGGMLRSVSTDKALRELKEEAASIGANAIINVKEDMLMVSGIAIRYK